MGAKKEHADPLASARGQVKMQAQVLLTTAAVITVLLVLTLLSIAGRKHGVRRTRVSGPTNSTTDRRRRSPRPAPGRKIRGMLYVGENEAPKLVELEQSGGVPLCPLCGMPMEKVRPIAFDRPSDIFIWRESQETVKWRCYHKYPVFFVPQEQ